MKCIRKNYVLARRIQRLKDAIRVNSVDRAIGRIQEHEAIIKAGNWLQCNLARSHTWVVAHFEFVQ